MTFRPICAVDTETTSLRWDREAWEIALIRRDPDGRTQDISMFVRVDLGIADPKSLELGGFYDRHPTGNRLATGDTPEVSAAEPEGAARIVQRLTHRATIIGAVPSFDTHVLERLLRRFGLQPSWHHRLRCVESLTAGHLGRDVGGLADCAEALGIDFPAADRHTASADARAALAVYDRILARPR